MSYLSDYTTDIGKVANHINTVIIFTEGSKIGTREDLISLVGLTYWNEITPSTHSCSYCFGKLRNVLITTNDGYQVFAEVPFTFASNKWQDMLTDLNGNSNIIGIETTGEVINNHYLKAWL